MDDDDDWQNCNLSKLKLEQEAAQFQYLLNDCQKWIEIVSGKVFKHKNDFRKSLEDGVILCELLNALKKGCIRRINKCSGPIAGIDNINLFLKACNQHFGVLQTNLFDSTDLEDLSLRGLNDSTISIDEQNRRLKKVVNTIHWLSRKTNELGIQLPYYLDLNSSSNNSNFDDAHGKYLKPSSSTLLSTSSSSSSSTLPTSLLTTVSSSNSNKTNNNNNNNNNSNGSISFLSTSSSTSIKSDNKGYKTQQQSFIIRNEHHSRESSADSLNLITSTSSSSSSSSGLTQQNQRNYDSDMPYIYKQQQTSQQQQQQQINKKPINENSTKQLYINTTTSNNNNNNSNNSNKISSGTFIFNSNNLLRKDSVETLDSISSTNSIKLLTTPNKNSSSSSSSSVSSATAIKYDEFDLNMQLPLNNNNSQTQNNSNMNHQMNQYDDDLDYIPSPTSSGIPTSPSVLSYLSTSSTTLTPLHNSSMNPIQTTTNTTTASTTYIPTRFTDRRTSQSSTQQDPFKFNVNYLDAGMRLARSAQEQLKIAEKIKDAKKESQQQAQIEAQLKKAIIASNNDSTSENTEDWQNSVDDWKKRRREKQKEKVLSQSVSITSDSDYPKPDKLIQSSYDDDDNSNKKIHSKFYKSATIAVSKFDDNKEADSNTYKLIKSNEEEITNNDYNHDVDTNEDNNNNNDNVDSPNKKIFYKYIEKFIQIERPLSYSSRGFGFLISNALHDNKLCPQVVVVEANSLAANAGLQQNDQVLEINNQSTNGLTNEQLRKIMRERLQQNSVDLRILRAIPISENEQLNDTYENKEQQQVSPNLNINNTKNNNNNEEKLIVNTNNNDINNIQHLPGSIIISTIIPKTVNINDQNLDHQQSHSQPQQQKLTSTQNLLTHQQFFAPKPFRRSVPNETSFLTTASSTTLITSTTTIQSNQTENKFDDDDLKVNNNSNPTATTTTTTTTATTTNNNTNSNSNIIMPLISPKQQDVPSLPTTEPPPLPKSEPPPIINTTYNETKMTTNSQLLEALEEVNINKAILDNIKLIDNWKHEQELLMKQKYEEEQNRIKLSFESNLDKIKEEEIKRREEIAIKFQLEKLKLEKEKLRLHDLEIKQREKDLQEKLRKQDEYKLSSALITNAISGSSNELKFDKFNETSSDGFKINQHSPISSLLLSPASSSSGLLSPNKPNKSFGVDNESDIHEVIKKVQDSMDHLRNDLLQKDMPTYANDVSKLNQNLEVTRKKQEEIERIKREQEMLKFERERIEHEKENLKKEAELLKQERELILSAASKKQQLFKETNKTSTPMSPLPTQPTTTNKHNREFSLETDAGYGTMTDLNEFDYYKNLQQTNLLMNDNEVFSQSGPVYGTSKQFANPNKMSLSYSNGEFLTPTRQQQQQQRQQQATPIQMFTQPPLQPASISSSTARKNAIITLSQVPRPKAHQDLSWITSAKNSQLSNTPVNENWLFDENEKQRLAAQQSRTPILNTNQQLRRSVPNLIESSSTPTKTKKSAVSNIQSPNTRLTTSQNDLLNRQHYQQQSKQMSTSPQRNNKLRQSTPSLYQQHSSQYNNFQQLQNSQLQSPNMPVINVFQKCANCDLEIGQNSAMIIEALNIAYHLQCFRCSVCNIPLGNGKEGTDVRVRGNQLHCNNCFSNEHGLKLSAV